MVFVAAPPDNLRLAQLCGPLDANLRQIEDRLGVRITRRDAIFHIDGAPVAQRRALSVLEHLHRQAAAPLASEEVELVIIEAIDADRQAQARARRAAAGAGPRPVAGDERPGADGARPDADGARPVASAAVSRAGHDIDDSTGRAADHDGDVALSNDGAHAVSRRPVEEHSFGADADADAAADGAGERVADAEVIANGESGVDGGDGEDGEDESNPSLHLRKAVIQGRTGHQRDYLRKVLTHDITFGIGPAGTGKTYLAVACAAAALERDEVARIVLTRPAVEAGERLGYLPGDLAQKVDPYLRPLYDALYDLMGFDKVTRLFERQSIEIAPLAYMRGRTLNRSFIILDEAQNTTPEQMKMFLTRIGFGSKAVVTGDVTQIDLPKNQLSGLVQAQQILGGVRGIGFTRFTSRDVVRHPLVARIVDAYERHTNDPSRGSGKP